MDQRPVITLPDPHAGQVAVLQERRRFNVVACGRRFGKTDLGCSLVTMAAVKGRPAAWFAPTYALLEEAWQRIHELGEPAIERSSKQDRVIQFRGGGKIDFWTLRQTTSGQSVAGRGRAYRVVVIDEAAMASCLEQDWTQAIRPTLTDYRGYAWLLSTPHGQGYFWRLWCKGEAAEPDWASFSMPTASNPYISADEIEQARRDLPRDAFAQEYLAEFIADAANPFGVEAIRAVTVEEVEYAEPVCWGVDLAKATDWTVATALDASGNVCGWQRWQAPWRNTIARLKAMIGSTPALIDSTGVGDPIVEQLQSICPNVEGYKFTQGSKQVLMEGLAVAIQQGAIRIPRGTSPEGLLIRELEAFRYEYRPSGVRYAAPEGMHDDAVDSLALAVHCRVRMPRAATLAVYDAEDGFGTEDDDLWLT